MSRQICANLQSDNISVDTLQIQMTIEEACKVVATDSSSSSLSSSVNMKVAINEEKTLIWLDTNVDNTNEHFQNILKRLRDLKIKIEKFTDTERCIEYLRNKVDTKVFMIVSDAFEDDVLHSLHGVDSIYAMLILRRNRVLDRDWMKEHKKIRHIFTSMDSVCSMLINLIEERTGETSLMNFVSKQELLDIKSTQRTPNQLGPSFMYSVLFKEIILEIDKDMDKAVEEFCVYCRKKNISEVDIEQFECSYENKPWIWWYSKDTFLHQLLNSALQSLDMECMTKMSFFIRALHGELKDLYHKQYDSAQTQFTVYRGQELSQMDFRKLQNSKDGLLFFNNFLSTTTDENIALDFMRKALHRHKDSIGILFVIHIDPKAISLSMNPFASIGSYSAFEKEREILFSTHTVFRVNDIKQHVHDDYQWEVQLMLTDDRDPYLAELTDCMRVDLSGSTGWYRLGDLLVRVGFYKQAEEIYNELLQTSTNDDDLAYIYHRLGWTKFEQGMLEEAAALYDKSLDISMKYTTLDDSKLCSQFNSLMLLCNSRGNYTKALEWCDKIRIILEPILPPDHRQFGTIYNNIGLVYEKLANYEKALQFYEKSHEILKNILLSNDPELATLLNNIATMYDYIGDYQKAANFYRESLLIGKLSLPSNHPDLAVSYNNIGLLYKRMAQYQDALECLEKAKEIFESVPHSDHSDLATVYNNIGSIHSNLNNYAKSLEFYENALKIRRKSLPSDHPDLAATFNNIGEVYMNMGEYSKAIEHYEKDQDMMKKVWPPDHPAFATSYDNFGHLHFRMGDFPAALDFYRKSEEIRQRLLPPDHIDLATSHLNFATCYERLGDYETALRALDTALHIQHRIFCKTISPVLPYCITYSWFGNVYRGKKDYLRALEYFEKCRIKTQQVLPENHVNFSILYSNMGDVHTLMGNYEEALSFLWQARNIQETIECDPLDCGKTSLYFGKTYCEMHEYSEASKSLNKALQIFQEKLPANHPDFVLIYFNMAKLYMNTKQYNLAKKYALQAVAIAEKKLSNHPHLVDYREILKEIENFCDSS